MLRVSTTTLESFRLYMNPEQEWMEEAELLATIRGEFTPTPEIKLGRAFGKLLETPEKYGDQVVGYEIDEFYAAPATMAPALELFDRRGVFEAKATKQYGDVVVVSKVDYLYGAGIHENKTTVKGFDFEKYAESCQWRFYLDAFEAAFARYNVFLLGQDDEHPNYAGTAREILLKGIESFNLFPYAELHSDCASLVRQFRAYAKLRGLEELLRERQIAAETGVYK